MHNGCVVGSLQPDSHLLLYTSGGSDVCLWQMEDLRRQHNVPQALHGPSGLEHPSHGRRQHTLRCCSRQLLHHVVCGRPDHKHSRNTRVKASLCAQLCVNSCGGVLVQHVLWQEDVILFVCNSELQMLTIKCATSNQIYYTPKH